MFYSILDFYCFNRKGKKEKWQEKQLVHRDFNLVFESKSYCLWLLSCSMELHQIPTKARNTVEAV